MPTLHGKEAEFGGGYVRIAFSANGERLKVGAHLSADRIRSFANHRRLISAEYIAVYPLKGENDELGVERHVIHVGAGNYDVIEGRKLNDTALTRDQAYALAGRKTQ